MKNIKKIFQVSFLTVTLFFSMKSGNAQVISDHFFGENAWMPDTVGNAQACIEPPCILYGKLHKQWSNIKSSGTSIVRFGGIAPDKNMPTNYQYIKMIDSIRAKGMEPIMQVPFCNNRYTAQQAADIVKFVNITKGKNIKYWIIGNEPDLGYSDTTSAQIANYIRPFSSAMKAIDPSILIVGPECAWYNQTIINGLTTPGGADDITGKDAAGHYYLDIISFHTYPFNGSQVRADVVSKLMAANSLNDNLISLNSRVANCNTYHNRTGAASLKTAITEANINWQNSSTDNLNGVGSNSFIGGQFVTEMMGIGMKNGLDFINMWSVIEGNTTASNIGIIDATNNNKKPLFYHFKLVADNFKGNYLGGISNQTNIKSFGSQNAQQVSVIILNEDLTNNFNYTVRLDNSAIAGTSGLKININGGLAKEYTDVISNQSSVLLRFDALGNIIDKTEYKLSGNADANLPPTVTTITTAPVATITPASTTTFCAGSSVVLNANTDAGYTYQWKKDNNLITGATATSYTATASGSYSVAVTYSGYTTTSAAQTVTVMPVPTAAITPVGSTSFVAGDSVVLNATTGTGYIYQWKKDGAAITGATKPSYVASQAGNYQIKTIQGSCMNWSAPLLITILPTATITSAGSTTFCAGDSVVLNANTGTGYTYQWKKDNNLITGATTTSYTATVSGSYSVAVTYSGYTTTSAAQTVTVMPVPTAAIIPVGSTTINAGTSIVLNANTGTGFTYLWKKDNSSISAANSASYSASATGNYQVEITQGICKALSAPISVDVLATPVAVITPTVTINKDTVATPVAVITPTVTINNDTVSAPVAVITPTVTINNDTVSAPVAVITPTITINSDTVATPVAVITPTVTTNTDTVSAPVAVITPTVTINNDTVASIVSAPAATITPTITANSDTVKAIASNVKQGDTNVEINVFPNPSNGKFTVQLDKENSGQNNINIQLLNSTGQEVYRKNFSFIDGIEKIDVRENIAPGLYVLRLINGNNITTKRIVIN